MRKKTFGAGPRHEAGEGGYSLAEVLATIVILGVLATIAVVILLGILEQRRVNAATGQFASDLRLAHTRATSELTDWRVVVVLERADKDEGPDYYLMRLARPYGGEGTEGQVPQIGEVVARDFDGNVLGRNVKTAGGYLADDRAKSYWASPGAGEVPQDARTRTIEFNSDGTMTFYQSPSGSVCITADGRPRNRVVSLSATSRVRVEADSSCDTSGAGG
ncbi:pilus assembly FimT family protein [Rubrobacter indicoceani]|uniref:pilus assembly FimT family protein n=1 Tax=Rubrobacter indicoceani TaxID=2051957 RepID=UPI000E5BB647|nr:type II secretion system protein [Rubrobacter indicoceani]